jgi:hypothetical protein
VSNYIYLCIAIECLFEQVYEENHRAELRRERRHSRVQCQNPDPKKKSLSAIIGAQVRISLFQMYYGELETLRCMHKYFQDFPCSRYVLQDHHFIGLSWVLTRIVRGTPALPAFPAIFPASTPASAPAIPPAFRPPVLVGTCYATRPVIIVDTSGHVLLGSY